MDTPVPFAPSADSCVPCELEAAAEAEPAQTRGWRGIIGVEGEMTGDGRYIEPNSLSWGNLPIPLRYVSADTGAHNGAQVVGQITKIERRDNGVIWAEGIFDTSELGQEAQRQVAEGMMTGVSMDLDQVSFEVRVSTEMAESAEKTLTNDDGSVTISKQNAGSEVNVTTEGRIRAATIVAIPAFDTARIELADDAEVEAALTASGDIPTVPPKAWFANPGLKEPTPFTVTPEGRVYGHLAQWGTCHVSHSHSGCVTAPKSKTNYAYFKMGAVLTAEGAEVAVGHITLDTRHAGGSLGPMQAAAHYDHTGLAAADVAAGEDSHGIWVAGALRPNVTEDQIRALRSAPLSGDWRRVNGNLELVAALAVNVPGFPIPRPAGMVASGAVQSLVASGILPPKQVLPPSHPEAFLSADDIRYLKQLAAREQAEETARIVDAGQSLAERVRATRIDDSEVSSAAIRLALKVRPLRELEFGGPGSGSDRKKFETYDEALEDALREE